MLPADHSRLSAGTSPAALLDAFRELHGRHLHGFAMLLLLGDAPRAAQLAVHALDAAAPRIEQLRHPERAAAWLRARVVHASRGMHAARGRLQPLTELGVEQEVASALGVLDHLERAALIADSIEGLDRRDVATVVCRDGASLDRLLARARRRYAVAHAAVAAEPMPAGPLIDRVHAEAQRAMG
jgi:DNA-directed RNA polymerase specialized sigma24 family protein